MSNASPWAGLGSLNLRKSPAAAPPPAATGDDEGDDFARPSVQRIVSAASPFDLPFVKTPAAGPAAATPPKEKPNMATQRAKPAHPVARDLQRRVGLALLEAESLSRDELAAQFSDLNSKRLAQTMFNMNTAKRAKRVNTSEGQVWQLTALGRKWMQDGGVSPRGPKVQAEAETAKPDKPKRAKAGNRMKKAAAAASATLAEPSSSTNLAIRAFEPVVERSFRCAVFSDGAFHLAKNGQAIDLTAAEFAEAMSYVKRNMAAQLAA